MDEANSEVLDGLLGRSIQDWNVGDGGMHLELDDGRVVVFAVVGGLLVVGVYSGADSAIH